MNAKMKKQNITRLYHLTDAELVVKAKEKISFIRRDSAEFLTFGITSEMIAELENTVDIFSDMPSDIEAKSDQAFLTQTRDSKAEELRVAIQNVMLRVQMTFGIKSPRYKAFGAGTISKQRGANLVTAGKTVVEIGTNFLLEISANGVTAEMLIKISELCKELETLILDQEIKVSDRSICYENKVEMGNALYTKLMSYTAIGLNIWETTSVARYNDYIIYGTSGKKVPIAE